MANYIAAADGNFNTGATWHLVDATSLLDSTTSYSTLTTAYSGTRSAAFTPGAIEIDGIAVKLRNRTGTTGTMSVELWNNTDSEAVAGTEVTINCADICAGTSTNLDGGWIFFKLSSPVTLEAAHDYCVEAKTSSASQVDLYVNGTADNLSRMLRTTTDAASPAAAASILLIMEEKTGAGAATTRTVTMDAVAGAITKYGSGTDLSDALTVCDGGTLNFGNSAATDYYLQIDGLLTVTNGGTLTMGTVANPIPRDSTAVLEFEPTGDSGQGLLVRNGATFTAQGLSRTSGKNIWYCKLNTDEAVNQTELGVDTDTGWLDNDQIGVASTTRTYSQCEKGALNGAAAAAALTVDGFGGAGGGIAYAHSGTSPTQAEIVLLTRNVKIRSTSSSLMILVNCQVGSTIDIDWVEIYYADYVASSTTSAGSFNMQYSSIHDCEDYGFYTTGSATTNITFSNNALYGCCSVTANGVLKIASTSGTPTVSGNIVMYSATSSGRGIYFLDAGCTITNNTACGINGSGFYIDGNGGLESFTGTISGNVSHSNNGYGLGVEQTGGTGAIGQGTIGSFTAWRNNSYGFSICAAGSGTMHLNNLTFNSFNLFGNSTYNFSVNAISRGKLTLNNCTFDSDASYATTTGFYTNYQYSGYLVAIMNSCNFSQTTAMTNDIAVGTSDNQYLQFYLNNCTLGGTNEVSNFTTDATDISFIKCQGYDGDTNAAKSWFKYGIITSDTTAGLVRTAAPSMRLTPSSASYKLASGSFKVNVNSGETCTPSVYVRESVVGDGTDYNGNRPRLILKRNDALGITEDTVIDTATVSAEGAFEELTGTTAAAADDGVFEFIIDCDGTTGWVNVDDFSATVA